MVEFDIQCLGRLLGTLEQYVSKQVHAISCTFYASLRWSCVHWPDTKGQRFLICLPFKLNFLKEKEWQPFTNMAFHSTYLFKHTTTMLNESQIPDFFPLQIKDGGNEWQKLLSRQSRTSATFSTMGHETARHRVEAVTAFCAHVMPIIS